MIELKYIDKLEQRIATLEKVLAKPLNALVK